MVARCSNFASIQHSSPHRRKKCRGAPLTDHSLWPIHEIVHEALMVLVEAAIVDVAPIGDVRPPRTGGNRRRRGHAEVPLPTARSYGAMGKALR